MRNMTDRLEQLIKDSEQIAAAKREIMGAHSALMDLRSGSIDNLSSLSGLESRPAGADAVALGEKWATLVAQPAGTSQ